MFDDVIAGYGRRVGYTDEEMLLFKDKGHRIRQVEHLARVAPRYSILAEVSKAANCNSGHVEGQQIILDLDGNFITKLCPKKICVYLASQMTIPVALINERLSEGLDPNDFHFMRMVRCPDAGVRCLGYGEVMVKVSVVPRIKTVETK